MSPLREWIRRPGKQFRDDLRADPYLSYLLGVAALLAGFGVWFRLPNFAAPDEYSRLIDPMKAAGRFATDPSLDSLEQGVTDGRALGATFYLYALVLAPVFLVVVASGQFGQFKALGSVTSRWTLWHAAPAWFWTAAILLGRLVTVLFAVGTVYLTYRIGTELEDRFAGRVAAGLLALSVGFLAEAHLIGEDVPMLFFLLVTLYLGQRFVKTGRRRTFYAACVPGGLAIAFKLSGGVAALSLGVALFERARRSDEPLAELTRPGLLVGGLAIGLVTVSVGIPDVLFSGPLALVNRAGTSIGRKTTFSGGETAPIWYWMVKQFLHGFGAPLFVAVLAGTVATVTDTVRARRRHPLLVLLIATVAIYLLVYSRWEFVRLRHLLPLFSPLLVFLAIATARRRHDNETAVRAALALLLVGTAPFVAGAEYQYVTDPRDEATAWLAANTDPGDTVTVYENSVADVAVVHGRETSHFSFGFENATYSNNLTTNESAYTQWMLSTHERGPAYIQLTASALQYLDEDTSRARQYPDRARYLRDLLAGRYNYTVAAEFGTRPTSRSQLAELLRAGVYPEVSAREQYVVILERTE